MRTVTAAALLAALTALAACGGGVREDPILLLTAEEALEEGQRLVEEGKYDRARDYLTHAFQIEPNSESGREALLLTADTHFLDGGADNFVKAEARYRDFQNRFPTSDRAAYVQMQIANSLERRMRKPDRDQSSTLAALEAYQEVLLLYPTSRYADEATTKIDEIRDRLAESDFLVGRYYLRSRRYPAAVDRLEELLESYPEYSQRDKALYFLGMAYQRSDQPEKAIETFERLAAEHSASEWLEKVPTISPPEEPAG